MRFLAPPTPSPTRREARLDRERPRRCSRRVGCALCHTPTLHDRATRRVAALRNQTVNLFSDLLCTTWASASPTASAGRRGAREFRTAPLWGLGQRIFFLHDGRTSDLVDGDQSARERRLGSQRRDRHDSTWREQQKQDLLNFLRSL